MNWSQTPKIRAWLKANYPQEYMAPTHGRALYLLYRTPRIYQTPELLVDPFNKEKTCPIDSITPLLS